MEYEVFNSERGSFAHSSTVTEVEPSDAVHRCFDVVQRPFCLKSSYVVFQSEEGSENASTYVQYLWKS